MEEIRELEGRWIARDASGPYRALWTFKGDGSVSRNGGAGRWRMEDWGVLIGWDNGTWDSFRFPLSVPVRGDNWAGADRVRAVKVRGPAEARLEVVTVCYNERFLAPLFLRHYDFADRIHVILDSDTDDGTREVLAGNSKVEVHERDSVDGVDDIMMMKWTHEVIRSRVRANWVVVPDMDEFVFSAKGESVRDFLARQTCDVVRSRMWQVYRHRTDSDVSPGGLPPVMQRRHGSPDRDTGGAGGYNKPILIRLPLDFELECGKHSMRGTGPCTIETGSEALDGAHWAMADPCFAVDRRIRGRRDRISRVNKERGLGVHLFGVTREALLADCERHLDDPLLF